MFFVLDSKFTFLAWSNSQLRGHACFLFTKILNEHRVVTARDIIDQLGEFWDDSPAKRGSRVGQCLTSSLGGIRISVNKCEKIKDITRNGYVFSDGVGTASFGVMELVQKRLKLPEVVSAIQIRYGGNNTEFAMLSVITVGFDRCQGSVIVG